ncbi:hypothetical protein RyT2_11420 [Pseudolactococcus yaeyamensis]
MVKYKVIRSFETLTEKKLFEVDDIVTFTTKRADEINANVVVVNGYQVLERVAENTEKED